MKVTLLGFTVPDDVLIAIGHGDSNLATQTHRFAWGVVNALRSAGVQVDLLSTMPVSDYPRNPKIYFGGGLFRQGSSQGRYIPFINLLALKHFTRWLSVWRIGTRHLLASKSEWLLVHGVHTPFLWFGVLVRKILCVKVGVFLTDPPGVVLDTDSRFRGGLKKLDVFLTKQALTRVDVIIALAEPLAREYAPQVRSLIMEGIFDSERWGLVTPSCDPKKVDIITYAGGVSEEYGVGSLVRAILGSDLRNIELRIYGRGALESWISEVAKVDPRVLPVAFVDPNELSKIYSKSSILVQPRPIDQSFVRYSFPSKLIEYMASCIPVVTTRLPSIPKDYEPYVVWAEDTELGLLVSFKEVLGWSEGRKEDFGTKSAEFIRSTRSSGVQGRRLREFLDGAM